VLESFLGREKLYFTKKYQNLFEKVARENLQKELMQLN
jgi:predicted metal-dependent HD superfamily phosphohydrolase